MTQPQVIVDDLLPFVRRNFWWHPFDRNSYKGVLGVMDLLYAKDIKERITGFLRVFKVWITSFVEK